MLLKVDDFNVLSSYTFANAAANNATISDVVPILSHNNANPPVYAGVAPALSNHYHARHRQLADFYF